MSVSCVLLSFGGNGVPPESSVTVEVLLAVAEQVTITYFLLSE